MRPSPVLLTSVPEESATASRSRPKCSRRSSSAATGPRRVAKPVDPTRSVITTVTVSEEDGMGRADPPALRVKGDRTTEVLPSRTRPERDGAARRPPRRCILLRQAVRLSSAAGCCSRAASRPDSATKVTWISACCPCSPRRCRSRPSGAFSAIFFLAVRFLILEDTSRTMASRTGCRLVEGRVQQVAGTVNCSSSEATPSDLDPLVGREDGLVLVVEALAPLRTDSSSAGGVGGRVEADGQATLLLADLAVDAPVTRLDVPQRELQDTGWLL